MTVAAPELLHLTPADYHVIRPEDFGAPGLVARESVGPFTTVQALGTLLTVHDSTFEPRRGIGHHPHQRMERLFYILDGTVDHDDALNGITGHMGTGDLGILTEGQRGMVHSEWNHGDRPARAYIFVYPAPTPRTASFDAVRDTDSPRVRPAPGVVAKQVVTQETDKLHGDFRALTDTTLGQGASFAVPMGPDEAGLVFVVDGAVDLREGEARATTTATQQHTVLLPPVARPRTLQLAATEPGRVLHAVTGRGFGLRRR